MSPILSRVTAPTTYLEPDRGLIHGPDGLTTYWSRMTPEIAAHLLGLNTKNRNLRQVKANQLAADIAQGEFAPSHQGIALFSDGTVADGQHRLTAVVLAGEPVWLMVTENLSRSTQDKIDKGTRRTVADSLRLGNYSYTGMLATAARYALAVEWATKNGKVTGAGVQRILGTNPPTDAQILAYVKQHEETFQAYAHLAGPAARVSLYVAPSPLLCAARFFPSKAAEFLAGMESGAKMEADDPRLRLSRYRGDSKKAKSRANMIMLPLKAMAAYEVGETIGNLTYYPNDPVRIAL